MPDITCYQDAVSYLESFILPNKQTPEFYRVLNLDRTLNLLKYLGNPHQNYPIIHIAGTSGKGSTSLMTAAILQSAGYTIGLHTSPHLQKVTERYQINQQLMPDEVLIQYCNKIQPVIEQIVRDKEHNKPTYFELLVCLAYLYFSDQKVDYAVIEVGLGGRFDATNVCQPKVAVLTNVGLDHTQILGQTIEKIVQEKMMIIKPNTIAVTGVTQPSALRLVRQRAQSVHAALLEIDDNFKVENYHIIDNKSKFDYVSQQLTIDNVVLNLLGSYQAENAALAITATQALHIGITEEQIRNALVNISFPGRIETVKILEKNLIIDGAHNPMKMEGFVRTIQTMYPNQKFPIIFGAKYDKDLGTMIQVMKPIVNEFILTTFHKMTDFGPNVMTPSDLIEKNILQIVPHVSISKIDVSQLRSVLTSHKSRIFIVTGSLYLAGAIRDELGLSWNTPLTATLKTKQATKQAFLHSYV